MSTVTNLHSWELDPKDAAKIQSELRSRLILSWDGRPIHTVGGVDIGLIEDDARAAIVILRFPELMPIESVTARAPITFPYIPGFLAFREGPAVLAAWEQLQTKPDLIMFDGQGIAHPRGVGIASQMGLWLDRPTIGVAKSRLYGRHAEPGLNRGDRADLYDQRDPKRIIGTVLRSKDKVNPLYISPGHLMDVEHAADFVLQCCTRYRLPEPTRWAHKVAGGEKLPDAPADTVYQGRLF